MPAEYDDIRERVERDKQELSSVRRELEKLGDSLRDDYVSRFRSEPDAGLFGEKRLAPRNRMCLNCLNSCKQPATVRIFHCAKYEPLG